MNDFVDRVGQYCKQGEESCNCVGVEAPCTFGCPPGTIFTTDGDPREVIRVFNSGATRDTDEGKLNFRRFFSPRVLRRRAEYMEKHRIQSNGELRPPDNWKKGIPLEAYADSLARHHQEFQELLESGVWGGEQIEEILAAVMFNCEGFLYELLGAK